MTRNRPIQQQLRLFKSDRLERLTTISPLSFVLLWSLVLSFVLFVGWGRVTLSASLMWIVSGIFAWTLFEYSMHRYLFHWEPKSRWARATVFVLHGNHHAEPGDRTRNLMPPIISGPISAAVWGLSVLVLGAPGSFAFLGFMLGYVAYDGMHFACHQYPMRGKVLWRWQQHHLRHHYGVRDGNFAITAILWDKLFRTTVPAKIR